ncbi:MAG: excinuclease ABC subunit UvrA [Myxococcales bacterium]|nr:excinuclease ABC subunit UvrA [Myxococcales bacterium]
MPSTKPKPQSQPPSHEPPLLVEAPLPPPVAEPDAIVIRGASEHNLQIDYLEVPKKRLVVFTGVSGSGKSSLAFDTIYAEGQRRYVESLSAYARQFLGQLDKPKYESLRGLSPTIAIEQKTASSNPRSTVGTVTEIYDYLRVLWARVGTQHCPQCGKRVAAMSAAEMATQLLRQPVGTQLMLMAPIAEARKGAHSEALEKAKKQGYSRARIDGQIVRLEDISTLSKKHKHTIHIVTDRITLSDDAETARRLADSLEGTLKLGDGMVLVQREGGGRDTEELLLSEKRACPSCSLAFPELVPQSFSFNTPVGMCPECTGLGTRMEMDPQLVIPDTRKSIRGGAIEPWATSMERGDGLVVSIVRSLSEEFGIDLDKPWRELSKEQQKLILYGAGDRRVEVKWEGRHGSSQWAMRFEGVLNTLMRRYKQTVSEQMREYYEKFLRESHCNACGGGRLRPESRAVYLLSPEESPPLYSLPEVVSMTVGEAAKLFDSLPLDGSRAIIAQELLKEIRARLGFLLSVGLDYLTLHRSAATLSGGEAQRIRLASQLGSELSGVLYVLDEPSIGLHQRDNNRLIETLRRLRDQGNSVLIVEHDADTMRAADWVVDFGPGAGRYGGKVVFSGTPQRLMMAEGSVTGDYLSGRRSIEVPTSRRKPQGFLEIQGARAHNLKNISVKLPLGTFSAITGVSGAGKSSLINGILRPALSQELHDSRAPIGEHDRIVGLDQLDKLIAIDQQPIGRTPRSNPATYTKAFDHIRALFAELPESRAYGYKPGRFSFNVKGGRCEACEGDGLKRVEMHFLADVFVPCEICKGRRYNDATLRVRYRDKSIADVLDLPIVEAKELFSTHPQLRPILDTLCDVGLGYLSLGQPATTLSGGEAQRVKLAKELCRRDTGRTLYLLDEPTTGLHFEDIHRLLGVLYRLVEAGNSVLVIEHNLDVIKCADWVIDLGPEGGERGGRIIAEGPPELIAETAESFTGQYLRPLLSMH